jgi:hypothetical protein
MRHVSKLRFGSSVGGMPGWIIGLAPAGLGPSIALCTTTYHQCAARAAGDGISRMTDTRAEGLSFVPPSIRFRSSQRDLCPGKVILRNAPVEAAKKWGNAGPGEVGVLDRHFAIPLRSCEGGFSGQPVIHDTLPRSKISPE